MIMYLKMNILRSVLIKDTINFYELMSQLVKLVSKINSYQDLISELEKMRDDIYFFEEKMGRNGKPSVKVWPHHGRLFRRLLEIQSQVYMQMTSAGYDLPLKEYRDPTKAMSRMGE